MKYDNIKTLNQRLKKNRSKEDKNYFRFLKDIENNKIPSTEIIFQFPIYIGDKLLKRHLQFYELYKSVQNLSGHVADVGTWKGSSMIFLSKLCSIFEKNSETKVYGFDWFLGQKQGIKDKKSYTGKYKSNYSELKRLLKTQNLSENSVLVKIDLVNELEKFFKKNEWLRFKYIFIDCGTKNVLEKCVPIFWSKLLRGGVMIFDHYNNENSPSESKIIDDVVKGNLIEKFNFSGHPSAFVYKKK